MANGTQLAFDNFIRGSYPVNLGGGDGWTQLTGQSALSIASAGTVEVSAINTGCGAFWSGLTWAPDQYSEITLGVIPPGTADSSVFVRMDASMSNGYRMDVHSTIISLYVFNSGTPTLLVSKTGLTVTSGDTFRLTVIGTTLVVTQNDTTIAFASDATVASGSAGCFMYNQLSTTTSSISSWRGGIPSGNTNGIWTKYGVVMPANAADILATGIPGTSNSTMLYEGNAQLLSGTVFKMWFQGASGVYYAESTDGKSWTRKSAVVIASRGIPKIFKNGATYYCHVTHTQGGPWTQIDQYTSTDGVNFTLAHANILSVGGAGTWDSAFCGYFQVAAIIGGTWYAMYDGQNGTTSGFGLATSPDGVTWTKSASNPVMTKAAGLDQAINIGGTYYAWLTEATLGQTGGGNAIIARYHTTDFINWTRDAASLQPDSVDEGRNYAPGQISVSGIVEASGSTYCFYSASPNDAGGGSYQIRLATTPQTIAQIISGGQEYFIGVKQVASDSFQRADGGLGANWTTSPSTTALQIASHLVEPSAVNTNCGSYFSGASFNSDQYSEITLATLADSNSFVASGARQSSSTTDHYGPSFSGAVNVVQTIGLYKVSGGITKQLGSNTTLTPVVGDKYRTSCVGTDISFFQNEHLLLQSTDASVASGSPSIGEFNQTTIANSQISAWAGGNIGAFFISGNVGVGGATVTYTGQQSGSVITDGSGNYFIGGLTNGNYIITPSLAGHLFTPASASEVIIGSSISGVNFTAGNYSVPDCRVSPPNSATFRLVQGTKIYDVQTSSNPSIPPADCRIAPNIPVDSRIAPNIPLNSRTPGTYGPGE